MNLITAYDCTGPNLSAVTAVIPQGAQMAGYTTGPGVAWSAEEFAAHPGAVRIDQDPAGSDHTADVLDVERGAATVADVPPWVRAAYENRAKGTRPGQRWPAIYTSASNMGAVTDALKAAGITSGAFLWVADWNLTQQEAAADITGLAPFPVIAVQFRDAGSYDMSLASHAWLRNVSGALAVSYPEFLAAEASVAAGLARMALYGSQHKS